MNLAAKSLTKYQLIESSNSAIPEQYVFQLCYLGVILKTNKTHSVIHYINRLKKKRHKIVSTDAKKFFKDPKAFMIKKKNFSVNKA